MTSPDAVALVSGGGPARSVRWSWSRPPWSSHCRWSRAPRSATSPSSRRRSNQPLGITTGPDGNLWYRRSSATTIGRVTPGRRRSRSSRPGITPGSQPGPHRRAGRQRVVHRVRGNRIGRITPAGVVTEFAAGITAGAARGITAGPDGNLWFTESARQPRSAASRPPASSPSSRRHRPPAAAPCGSPRARTATCGSPRPTGDRIGRITPAGVVTEFSAGITPGSDPVRHHRRARTATCGSPRTAATASAASRRPASSPSSPPGITPAAAPSASPPAPTATSGSPRTAATAIGRITPGGRRHRVHAPASPPAAVRAASRPGPDGNLWFTECTDGQHRPASVGRPPARRRHRS